MDPLDVLFVLLYVELLHIWFHSFLGHGEQGVVVSVAHRETAAFELQGNGDLVTLFEVHNKYLLYQLYLFYEDLVVGALTKGDESTQLLHQFHLRQQIRFLHSLRLVFSKLLEWFLNVHLLVVESDILKEIITSVSLLYLIDPLENDINQLILLLLLKVLSILCFFIQKLLPLLFLIYLIDELLVFWVLAVAQIE